MHRIDLDAYDYRWYRVGGLQYAIQREAAPDRVTAGGRWPRVCPMGARTRAMLIEPSSRFQAGGTKGTDEEKP